MERLLNVEPVKTPVLSATTCSVATGPAWKMSQVHLHDVLVIRDGRATNVPLLYFCLSAM